MTKKLRILLLCHAFNSLTQRIFLDLKENGHTVAVEFDINSAVTAEALSCFTPDLIIAPFLKTLITQSIWQKYLCIIIHPGIIGDRGPSSLDWAIMSKKTVWGVTAIQANDIPDGGDIWGSIEFPMRSATKASLYRNEVTTAAVLLCRKVITNFINTKFQPLTLNSLQNIQGSYNPLMKQETRKITWETDNTKTILKKIQAADGAPGVLDSVVFNQPVFLYAAHAEPDIKKLLSLHKCPNHIKPGAIIGKRNQAILVSTIDSAIWIGQVKPWEAKTDKPKFIKIPATQILKNKNIPDLAAPLLYKNTSYQEIGIKINDSIASIYFEFYNGAMSTEQCQRLLKAIQWLKSQNIKALILMGGYDYWSNGINLNTIEAAESPADESLRNINAINDIVLELIKATDIYTVAALRGNISAGGVFMALACDKVVARNHIILTPHYKNMGNLYGSEYWTYLLPKRVGAESAQDLIKNLRLPITAKQALKIKLIDKILSSDRLVFEEKVTKQVLGVLKNELRFNKLLNQKQKQRERDEKTKKLELYREEELKKIKHNFYGLNPSYHVARYNFVHKIPYSRTPLFLAIHRNKYS